MVGRSIVAVSFLGLAFFSVSVYGFSSSSSKTTSTKPSCNGSKYYSYKTFKRLGVPAILYSTVAKVATRVMRVKPQQVVPFNASVSSTTKVALITGSNTGVGFETAKALAVDHGYEVIIACRSAEKGAKTCAAINAAVVPNATSNMGKAVFVQPLDLSNLDSVRDFGRAVHEKYKSIDVLVNNAGKNSASGATQQFNDDQTLDDLFTTNFLGHFLLTNILLDKCSRIVNLSSVMHHFPIYAKDDVYQDVDSIDFWRHAALEPAHDRDDLVRKPYAASKLAALLFSIELNRRYGQTTNEDNNNTLRSIAVNPGSV
jgi:NAD(P)-dependent dehydrogenase (short-subunit alcohol dehydrogenase family)